MIESFIRHYADTYRAYKNGRWCYEDGCLYKGLADLHAAGEGDWTLERLIEQVNQRIDSDGTIEGYRPEDYTLDNICAGKVLFMLAERTGDARYVRAMETLRGQFRDHPRTREGSFWHKKVYPWQVWLDGLYMAPPFLARYSLDFEAGDSLADIRNQFEIVRRVMRDPRTGLYYHGYDESRASQWADPDSGLSSCFWSRAIGWYAMALVDLVDIVPPGHPDREFYGSLLAETAMAVLAWQGDDGLWMQVMDQSGRPGNYPESSASAMFAYAFLKGCRLGVLDASFVAAARRAYDGIVGRYLRVDGREASLGGICLMAGLGTINPAEGYRDGSFAYYIGEPVVENDPKGVGPFMMARAELQLQAAGTAVR